MMWFSKCGRKGRWGTWAAEGATEMTMPAVTKIRQDETALSPMLTLNERDPSNYAVGLPRGPGCPSSRAALSTRFLL